LIVEQVWKINTALEAAAEGGSVETLEGAKNDDERRASSDNEREQALAVVLADWNKLVANLEAFKMLIEQNGSQDEKFRAILAEVFLKIDEKVRDTDAQAQLMVAKIESDTVASDKGALTVWNAIRVLQEDIRELKMQAKETLDHLPAVRDDLKEVNEKLQNVGLNLENLAAHHKRTVEAIQEQFRSLGGNRGTPIGSDKGDILKADELAVIKARMSRLEYKDPTMFTFDVNQSRRELVWDRMLLARMIYHVTSKR
jgi:chromosome segregation ATPase